MQREDINKVQSVPSESVQPCYEAPPQPVNSDEEQVPLNKGTIIFILTTIAFLILFCVGYACGVFYTRIGHQLDIKKTMAYVVIVLIVEGYVAWKTFGESEKKNPPSKTTSYKLLPSNNYKSDVITIKQTPFSIGKDETQVNGVIMDPKVSRVHAVFILQEGGLYLKDANSLNGTYVNEMRLTPQINQLLHPGDAVRFADVMYQVSV